MSDIYNSKFASLVGRFMNPQGSYAVTTGPETTRYSCDEKYVHPYWRAHEDCHKAQWKRDGRLKFLVSYFTQFARNVIRLRSIQAGYLAIDYEVEARAAADASLNRSA